MPPNHLWKQAQSENQNHLEVKVQEDLEETRNEKRNPSIGRSQEVKNPKVKEEHHKKSLAQNDRQRKRGHMEVAPGPVGREAQRLVGHWRSKNISNGVRKQSHKRIRMIVNRLARNRVWKVWPNQVSELIHCLVSLQITL